MAEDERDAAARLVGIAGPVAGQAVTIPGQGLTIGRSLERGLVIPGDRTVSRAHATIVREGEHYVVTDEGSTHGTWVNGERVGRRVLAPGDVLRIGEAQLRFEPAPVEESAAPPVGRPEGPAGAPVAAGGRIPLPDLLSEEYEHPFDRRALDALKRTPGLDVLVRKLNQYGIEKFLKIQFTGSHLRVNAANFPELHGALEQVCQVLGLPDVPQMYVRWSYDVNALTAGVERPIVVLHSGSADLLTPDEMLYVLGHEIGHIKSQHVLYQQMASVLPILGGILASATLGMGDLLTAGIQLALFHWVRMAEFTADRAGLLACQNLTAATTALIKMAGMPRKYFGSSVAEDFITQAREFEEYDYDTLDRVTKALSIAWQGHPWTVMRAAELLRWVDSGGYDAILSRQEPAFEREL